MFILTSFRHPNDITSMLNIIMDQETSSIIYNLIIIIEIFLIDFYVFMDPNIFPGKVRRLTSSDWICNGSFLKNDFQVTRDDSDRNFYVF